VPALAEDGHLEPHRAPHLREDGEVGRLHDDGRARLGLLAHHGDGAIPAEIIYQDDVCLAFKDINPAAPVHILLIPKEHIATLNDVGPQQEAIMGHLLATVRLLAEKLQVTESGYRVVINCNADAGQAVFHIHLHLLGGRQMSWPPG